MFITCEGIEGSGKTTLLTGLQTQFYKCGTKTLLTKEPGGCTLGKKLRALLLDPANSNFTEKTELFLYLADRAQHVAEIIRPALAANITVLCDRYVDSTIAYQGHARGLDIATLYALNNEATDKLWPELTLLIDLPVELGLPRARQRNTENNCQDTEGRFEIESYSFHEKVRAGYLRSAKEHPERFFVLDGTQSPEVLCATAWQEVQKHLHMQQ